MQKINLDLDTLLITNPTNIRYLTGFVGAAPAEREAYLLLTQNTWYLFTNSLYLELAKQLSLRQNSGQAINNFQLTIIEVSSAKPFYQKLSEVLAKEKAAKLEFEEENLTVAELKKINSSCPSVTFVATNNRIEELRMTKRDDEIEKIKKAAKLTDECFDYVLGTLRDGVLESDISWEIESFFRKHNASIAFSPIVAFGKNSSMPHYQTADSCKLAADSCVLLDFGAKVDGYCADLTRVVFFGKPRDEWTRAYQAVLKAQEEILNLLGSHYDNTYYHSEGGASGSMLDRRAREIIGAAGFQPYSHSLGHGVGLAIHENPRLTIHSDATLKPGMVFSIEPGIYIEGQFGVRIEDLVLVQSNRIEILSKAQKDLIIL